MRQLNGRNATMAFQKLGNALKAGNMLVRPNPAIVGRDTTFGRDGRRLDDDQPRTTDRPTTQMDEVPFRRVPIAAAVLAHWGDPDAICDFDGFYFERGK